MAQYYFAYGADMDPKDLGLRCEMRRKIRVEFAEASPAVLKGYRLLCNIPSQYRNGGIFNIVPDPRGSVHGVAYTLHAGDELARKQVQEGESRQYAMPELAVRTSRGKTLTAKVLRAQSNRKELRPAADYLTVVIGAAKRHRLPRLWISRLEKMKS